MGCEHYEFQECCEYWTSIHNIPGIPEKNICLLKKLKNKVYCPQ